MKIVFALLILILLAVFFSHSRRPEPPNTRVPVGQVVFSNHPEANLANQIIAYETGGRR
jgi:hypothetical protein